METEDIPACKCKTKSYTGYVGEVFHKHRWISSGNEIWPQQVFDR